MSFGKITQYAQNPAGYALQKYMFELLKERYGNHQEIMERLCHYLVTESDMHKFAKMAIELYDAGFTRAVEEHKDQLAKLGLKARVMPARQNPAENHS